MRRKSPSRRTANQIRKNMPRQTSRNLKSCGSPWAPTHPQAATGQYMWRVAPPSSPPSKVAHPPGTAQPLFLLFPRLQSSWQAREPEVFLGQNLGCGENWFLNLPSWLQLNHAEPPARTSHASRWTTSAQRQYETWQVARTHAFAQQQGAKADGQPVATAAAGSRAVQCGAACRRARSGT
jgi:hypothetical protein